MQKSNLSFVLIFMAALLTAAYGWPNADQVQNIPGSNHGWNASTGTWQPIGVSGDGATLTSPPNPATSNSHTAVSVTSSAQNVTRLSGRSTLAIFNLSSTETIWVSLDSATASATTDAPSIPIRPYGFLSSNLADSKVISLITSTTATATVYQEGF